MSIFQVKDLCADGVLCVSDFFCTVGLSLSLLFYFCCMFSKRYVFALRQPSVSCIHVFFCFFNNESKSFLLKVCNS